MFKCKCVPVSVGYIWCCNENITGQVERWTGERGERDSIRLELCPVIFSIFGKLWALKPRYKLQRYGKWRAQHSCDRHFLLSYYNTILQHTTLHGRSFFLSYQSTHILKTQMSFKWPFKIYLVSVIPVLRQTLLNTSNCLISTIDLVINLINSNV